MNHDDPLALAPTVADLGADPRRVFDDLSSAGLRYVQLDAALDGLRPRQLDQSARRDLLAALRRRELVPAGVDLWIPVAHFRDAARVDRAVAAVQASIQLAADLGRIPLSLSLPADVDAELAAALGASAQRHGVELADHAVPRGEHAGIAPGVDPVAWLSHGEDPAAAVTRAGAVAAARLDDIDPGGVRVPVGTATGRLDLLAYRVALTVAGYRRPVVLDQRQLVMPRRCLEASVNAWRETAANR